MILLCRTNLLLLLLLGATSNYANAAPYKQRRVQSRNRHHTTKNKVRGGSAEDRRRLKSDDNNEPPHSGTVGSESYYGSAFSDDTSKMSKKTSAPKVPKSPKKSGMGKGKGGSHKASDPKNSHKSDKSHHHTTKSMKSSSRSDNIFDHSEDSIQREIVPVECGSEKSPFLSTFVASIQMQPIGQHARRKGSSKTKRSKMLIDVDDSEEDGFEDEELPFDGLSPGEQMILERLFRNVYNTWTFVGCDGFFRDIHSASMILVDQEDDEEEYSVILQNTYRMDGTDEVEMSVINNTRRWRLNEFRMAGLGHNGTQGNATSGFGSTNTKEEDPDSPTTYVQTVSGGENLPIYYVQLVATCRNCAVTDEVNFPLLMYSEEEEHSDSADVRGVVESVDVSRVVARQGEDDDEKEEEEENVCTCPLPVEDNEAETSRRRNRQRRRLDGHNLYEPPPNSPTPDQYIRAMNAAIRAVQETEGKLLRVAGIADLIEPDYLQGENPELQPNPTESPTVSPQPTGSAAPTQIPTTPFPIPTLMVQEPTQVPNNATVTVEPTEGSVPLTRPPRTTSPTPPPPPTIAPTSAAATQKVVAVWWGLVVPALALLWC